MRSAPHRSSPMIRLRWSRPGGVGRAGAGGGQGRRRVCADARGGDHGADGDLDGALALAERSVEAYRVHGDADYGYPRAFRAGLLLRLGREDEGLAELARLRRLLTRDPDAVS